MIVVCCLIVGTYSQRQWLSRGADISGGHFWWSWDRTVDARVGYGPRPWCWSAHPLAGKPICTSSHCSLPIAHVTAMCVSHRVAAGELELRYESMTLSRLAHLAGYVKLVQRSAICYFWNDLKMCVECNTVQLTRRAVVVLEKNCPGGGIFWWPFALRLPEDLSWIFNI